MTFINLKHFKETVATVTKISDSKNPTVKISLSKDNDLSFRILFGIDGQVSLPVESQTIKDRSQISSKDAIVSVEILSRIVRNLPVLLEEVEIEFASPGLVITGSYGEKKNQSKPQTEIEEEKPLYSMRYELHNCLDNCAYLRTRDYDLTEEKVLSFSTGADSASVLGNAAKIAQKASHDLRLDNLFLSCKGDEILVLGTDGSRIMQKYVYTQEILTQDIDFIVSSELGLAIGKFAFTIAHWEIYQNFVKVTLDEKIEIFAVRPLMEFPNFQKWENKSQHTSLVVNVSELKTRLNKLGKDVWLWLYTVEDRLAIECYQSDSVGVSWVKNTLKTPPALIIVNSKMLLDVVKTVKKGTAQLRLMLPKLVGESEADDFFNKGKDVRNVAYLEFDKNSYLVAGRNRQNLRTPPGVRDWLTVQGWSILPESKPSSTAAKSAVKILSDRWTGKGWERPELVACECGTIHDESDLTTQIKKVHGYCDSPACEDYRELALYRIDYRCTNPTCNTLNTATVDRPLADPICMNCGKKEFTTQHYFECGECERPVTVNDCKTCHCDTILEENVTMWQCCACESTFFVDDICEEEDLQYLQGTELDTIFIGCPCCERFDVELTSSQMYACHECGSITHDNFYVPAIEAPALPCPDCNQDLTDAPPQKVNDLFVVGSVTRF